MEASSKLSRLLRTSRDQKEIEDWIFSLTPLGVAFVFFIIFVLPMDLPNKDMIVVTGIAAGFTGLQSYWIFRGWRKSWQHSAAGHHRHCDHAEPCLGLHAIHLGLLPAPVGPEILRLLHGCLTLPFTKDRPLHPHKVLHSAGPCAGNDVSASS